VKAYLQHLAGGSVVVVNIIGLSDHRTLATYVLICWGYMKDLLYQQTWIHQMRCSLAVLRSAARKRTNLTGLT